jgi:Pregnancy-associated plasma protein-A/Secretion system C-terminal sorting domain/Bacterial pre-peptidase C-terminal domain/Fibronectin type III domain
MIVENIIMVTEFLVFKKILVMKKITLLTSFTLLCLFANAQRTCGSAEHFQQQLQTDANFFIQHQNIEQHTLSYASNPPKKTRSVITIPVVVHVVYNTTLQNISDAQIQSQIVVLNADFRKLNTNFSSTPSVFQPMAADCEIQFAMAQQDPNGVASNGIERVSTTTVSFATNDAVKYAAQGGANAWDRNKYLNIWVCKLSSGVLGYAQYPGGAAATDGVVINYTAFGTTGTASQGAYNKGRTATHEIGHWLNLFHIWGDDGGACSGSDQVNDTPNQGAEHYGVPTFPQLSCNNGPDGDMYMNYMDYSDDVAMTMFTTGQKTRMQALFAVGGFRNPLLTSNGATLPTPTTCDIPAGISTSALGLTTAILNWNAINGATSYNIKYKLSNAITWASINVTSNTYTLNNLWVGGSYQFMIQTVCSFGNSDFSLEQTFTLPTNSSVCSDPFESNNFSSSATKTGSNLELNAIISNPFDVDYFEFNTTAAQPKIKISITNLPANYELRLLNTSLQTIATSANSGTTNEIIKYNPVPGGKYYVVVSGFQGAYSPSQCYHLSISTSAANYLREAMETNDEASSVYPNPAHDNLSIRYFLPEGNEQVNLALYNALGQKVMSQQASGVQGDNETSMNVSQLPRGIYFTEVTTQHDHHTYRVVID